MNATNSHSALIEASSPLNVLQSALTALGEGRISEVIDAFDDRFTFDDQALKLQFTDKERLHEFFLKARELFPDTTLEVLSTLESGYHVVAEWKITTSQLMPLGLMQLRVPISFQGASIVRIKDERIISWSDYYDPSSSRRFRLGAFFTDWIEY